jgi:hypothetical protein
MCSIISSNKYGSLYKLNKPYIIKINNSKTPFGIQKSYNRKLIHWYIKDFNDIKLINHFKEYLLDNILNKIINTNDLFIDTKLSKKDNFPFLLETIINPNISSNDCIKHSPGEIITYDDIIKGLNANIIVECSTISVNNNKVNMIWYINNIEIIVR